MTMGKVPQPSNRLMRELIADAHRRANGMRPALLLPPPPPPTHHELGLLPMKPRPMTDREFLKWGGRK